MFTIFKRARNDGLDQWRKSKWWTQIMTWGSATGPLLRAIVKAIRQFSTERDQKKISPAEYYTLAMDLIATAISAGAFQGNEWLMFRTRLANDPSLQNAVRFLEQYKPDSWPTIKVQMDRPDDGTFLITCHIDRFAEQFEAASTSSTKTSTSTHTSTQPLAAPKKRKKK